MKRKGVLSGYPVLLAARQPENQVITTKAAIEQVLAQKRQYSFAIFPYIQPEFRELIIHSWRMHLPMKYLIVFTALLICGATAAFGAPSQQNRDDSILFVGIGLSGLHIPTLLTQPITFGIYLGSSFLFGVESGNFAFDDSDFDSDADESFAGNFSNAGAYLRWFPNTNSFNYLFTVHKQKWKANFIKTFALDQGGTADLEALLRAEATVLTAGISNQWISDIGVVVSVDWLVVSTNLNETHEFEVISDSSILTAEELARYDAEIQEGADLLNDLSRFPGALILPLGFAF